MRPPLEVTIQGERGAEWERVCGTRQFPVTTWEPMKATVMGQPNTEVWLLNLLLIDKVTLDKILAHVAAKFNQPLAQIQADVAAHGIPILAEDAYVALNDPQRWVG